MLLDIGNGIYDPARNLKYNYENTQILGTATKTEAKWANEKARYEAKRLSEDEILKLGIVIVK